MVSLGRSGSVVTGAVVSSATGADGVSTVSVGLVMVSSGAEINVDSLAVASGRTTVLH